ncbi:MAG: lamin tail domain-containing protein [Methanomicrobiales archaeon]|nr:lamin tail domain-containing protein [Methanomicrobiales archaeon]
MKMSTGASIGLIFGILILLGFAAIPVSASNDNSWFGASIDPWAQIPSQPTNDGHSGSYWGSTGTVPWYTPTNNGDWFGASIDPWAHITPQPTNDGHSGSYWGSTGTVPWYTPTNNANWVTVDSLDQVIAWGKTTTSRYNTNGYVPVNPGVMVTPIPTIPPVFPYSTYFTNIKPTPIPSTPYSTPSLPVTAVPTYTPTPGSVVPNQKTGISLAELNLQGKYVRITNTGITPVVMTGWKITNKQGNSLTFIDYPMGGGSTFTYVLNPYSTLTVYFGKEGTISSTELYYPWGTDFWNHRGDTAFLYNPQGELVGKISA